jgi:membrane protein YdbS with pleckstrin-like domain
MSEPQPPALVDLAIIDSLDMTSRRLSKFSLYWYLKALPELTIGSILTIIPLAIGAILSLILLIDWGIHRAFSQSQIETALNYDFDTVDDAKLQEWLDSPQLADWISGLSVWVFVIPILVAIGLIVGWLVIRTLQWRRIRFGAEDGVLWMSGGLFTNWSRRLPIVHVQSVEFRSTLLQRMLTLRGVSISSAAPEGKNASIELLAIRRGVAADFATTIQTAFGATIATPESGDAGSTPIA